jgi:Leucine-rich repeat (LRR) protein
VLLLSALPDGIAKLTGLTMLDVANNKLIALPDWLTELRDLTALSVVGNPLVSPPPEITTGGSESVLTFIRARMRGSDAQWLSKLLVVGEGGVGKTSLGKALARVFHAG